MRDYRDWYTVPKNLLTNDMAVDVGSGAYPDSGQLEKTTLSDLAGFVQSTFLPDGVIQSGTDHRLYAPDGSRLYLRGIQVYNNCFALFADGYRFDWFIRYSQDPLNIPLFSEPIRQIGGQTWLATTYVNDATSRAYLTWLKATFNVNTFRIWVGIGMIHTEAYTDKLTGLQFPPELEILDKIVSTAGQLGCYVWMSFAQGSAPDSDAATFWAFMADRYKLASNVLFDLENEPGSGIVYVNPNIPTQQSPYSQLMNTLAKWTARFSLMLTAVRNAGFVGPVAVQTWQNLDAIDTIVKSLDLPPFSTDPNLLVAPHIYYTFRDVPTAFSSTEPVLNAHVYNYQRYFTLIAGEFGFTNDFPFSDPTAATAWNKAAAGWLQQDGINGAIFFTAPPNHDALNYIFDDSRVITPWGNIVKQYNTNAAQTMADLIPVVTSTGGDLTDTTGTDIKFSRAGERVDMSLNVVIVTNGTANGVLLVQLPAKAALSPPQTFQGWLNTGTPPLIPVFIQVFGYYAQIVKADLTYPGADGSSIRAAFTYYCAPQDYGISYTTQTFDGTYWLTRGGNLTGISDGQEGTCVFTITMLDGDDTQQDVISTNNQRFAIIRNVSNQMQIQLRNASNVIIGSMVSNPKIIADGTKWTFMCAWSLGTTPPTIRMFINGVGNGTFLTQTNDVIDYTDGNIAIGGSPGGHNFLRATMDFLWFHPTYIEPANFNNYGAFFDYRQNPVDLGAYGDKPLFVLGGQLPILFLRQTDGTAASFDTNRGTGGGFTNNPIAVATPSVRISSGQAWSTNAYSSFAAFGLNTQVGLLEAFHVPIDQNGNPGLMPITAGTSIPSAPNGFASYTGGFAVSIGRASVLSQVLLQIQDGATPLPIIEYCIGVANSTWTTGPTGGLQPGGTSWTNQATLNTAIQTLLPQEHLLEAVFGDVVYTQSGSATDTVAAKEADLTAMLTDYDALSLPGTGLNFFLGMAAPTSNAVVLPQSWWGTYAFCRTNAPGQGGTWSGRCFGTTPWYQWAFAGPTDPGYGNLQTGPYGTVREGEFVGYVAWLVENKSVAWTPLWRSLTNPITRSGNTFIVPFDRPAGPDFAAGVMTWASNADDGIKVWPQFGWHVKRGGIEIPLVTDPVISGLDIILDIGEASLVGDEVSYAFYGPGGTNPGLNSGVGGNLVMTGPPSVLFPTGYNSVSKTIDAWAWPFAETVSV